MPEPAPSTHRVVITGAGLITSMGTGWRVNADGFREGRSALREITLFDASRQRVQQAGEVVFDQPLPASGLSARQVARMDRASKLLLYAGVEAVKQSGWTPEMLSTEAIPLCLGTSAGAMAVGETYFKSKTQQPGRTSTLAEKVILYQPHTQAQFLMDGLGFNGPITIIANACASGANAIGHAFRLIKTGRTTRAIAGGYDALAEMVFAGFDSLQALSTTTPRPFAADRDGLALGEGAGVVTLERYEDAVARGADIIAEVIGYGAATDLHHLTQPHPQGDAALLSMTRACEEAGVGPSEIRYINSHGTGTPLNDVAEGMAIQRWAGADVGKVMVSSTKGAIGHLLGGAGAVEAIICLIAMREGFVPPNAALETPDPVCTFDLVREPRDADLDCVLTNSFGFGGANATLVMRRGDGQKNGPDTQQEKAPASASPTGGTGIRITGWGAVSPAGWSASALHQAVNAGSPLPTSMESRGGDAPECVLRKAPAMSGVPDWMKQPRLRRTTTAAKFAVAAAVEALGTEKLAAAQSGTLRVGVVFCTMNGCVQFSRRFFTEVLSDPNLASPILFPETVYNAPASHLSALLQSREFNNTLVGDSAQFLRGMELGKMWLDDRETDAVLVVAAEELDWLCEEALMLFDADGIATEGGAAVLMERGSEGGGRSVQLTHLTEPWTFGNSVSRDEAAQGVKADLCQAMTNAEATLLCDSAGMTERAGLPEHRAWADWSGPRASVRTVLGEGFSVTGGWQVVQACEAIASGACGQALVSSVGLSEQAVGAILAKA